MPTILQPFKAADKTHKNAFRRVSTDHEFAEWWEEVSTKHLTTMINQVQFE